MDFRRLLREERLRAQQQWNCTKTNTTQQKESLPESRIVPDELMSNALSCWNVRSPIDLSLWRVPDINTVYYIPHWISEAEEQAIHERINDQTNWTHLKYRRLQMYGGHVTSTEPFYPQTLPKWLEQISTSLVESKIFRYDVRPNHCLINEYGSGDCIMPHEDGPAYYPLVVIISTGADAQVSFTPHRNWTRDVSNHISFTVQRRSLLLFMDDAYTKYLHSIDGIENGTRRSLTIRHVRTAQSG